MTDKEIREMIKLHKKNEELKAFAILFPVVVTAFPLMLFLGA